MSRLWLVALTAGMLVLSGCAGPRATGLSRDSAAYSLIPPPPETPPAPQVRLIRAGDELAVGVFREPEMSVPKTIVDELGNVQLPLLGEVAAAGLTPSALSQRIAGLLGQRYLKNPQVTVSMLSIVPRSVTVEGQVRSPGTFALSRNDTLLSTLARAGSPTDLARLDEVVVFRTVNGQRMGAVFDARKIRVGQAPDPQIVDGDTVVVGYSEVRGAFRDFLAASPLINLFTVF